VTLERIQRYRETPERKVILVLAHREILELQAIQGLRVIKVILV